MEAFELIALTILGAQLALSLKWSARRGALARRMLLISVAAWIAEDSCIRIYEFYSYAPRWALFVDKMPLVVALIWAGVLTSTEALMAGPRRWWMMAGVASLIVLSDAMLIEPVSVRYGLWVWHEPGFFNVPPVGVLGWFFFALSAQSVFFWARDSAWREALVLVLAPLATHFLLLASWWGLLRWVSMPIPTAPFVAVVWAGSLSLSFVLLRRGVVVSLRELMLRFPGALFFFGLLVVLRAGDLSIYVGAFALPYLLLVWRAFEIKRSRAPG